MRYARKKEPPSSHPEIDAARKERDSALVMLFPEDPPVAETHATGISTCRRTKKSAKEMFPDSA